MRGSYARREGDLEGDNAMKRMAIAVTATLITGCATAPQLLPVEVKIPIAVSCIEPEQIPAKPAYQSLSDNDSTPDGTVILHVVRDFAKSLPCQQQLEAAIGACR
jgi:uncharacterized lipoprotein YajG